MRYAFLFLGFACSAAPAVEAPLEDTQEAPIYGGVADHDEHAAVVLLTHETEDGLTLCTGTLVASRVVLTAAHCVLRDVPSYVVCGGSTSDRVLAALPASDIEVRTGWKPKLAADAEARGRRLFLPKMTTLCDRDVAVLVLDQDLSVAPLAVAHALPDDDDAVMAVGYGKTEHGTTGERRRRDGMHIVNVGPEQSADVWLGARELETTAGPCSGDSGGPLLDASGEVVGVVSRGGSCRSNRGNIYSNAVAWQSLVDDAVAWAATH